MSGYSAITRKRIMIRGRAFRLLLMIGIVLLSANLWSCARDTSTSAIKASPTSNSSPTKASPTSKPHPTQAISGPANQPVTYSTDPQDVIIRILYGGGQTGALALAPQISIYGDGSYILGTSQRGKLSSDVLQSLLNTLVNNDQLLTFTRQTFSDIADQNMTFLELQLNGKQRELIYGSFGHYQTKSEDMDEYERLEKALRTIIEMVQGPTQAYKGTRFALLARQIFNQDPTKVVTSWSLPDFTLAQAAVYECGVIAPDDTSQNAETGCLKFIIPSRAVLLTTRQTTAIESLLQGTQGIISEQGLYYQVTLRPLLPDELASKALAMLGGNQNTYIPIVLHEGSLPPVPIATPIGLNTGIMAAQRLASTKKI
jgi:hypothetical protein